MEGYGSGKMISVKLPKMKKSGGNMGMPVALSEQDAYPYGLRITLNEDQVKKMEQFFDEADADGKVSIHAIANIVRKSSEDLQGGKKDRRLELQITDIACKSIGSEDEDKEYYAKRQASKMG